MTSRDHWESIYERKAPEQVSWYRPHLERSLDFIHAASLASDASIIDVGEALPTLVDDLLARGYTNVTVLDISASAIDAAKARLGERASMVRWLVADVMELDLGVSHYDFWHDRAVFHFLRDPADRRRYVAAVRQAVKPGGHVLVATFGPEGPERCSDLEVVRYASGRAARRVRPRVPKGGQPDRDAPDAARNRAAVRLLLLSAHFHVGTCSLSGAAPACSRRRRGRGSPRGSLFGYVWTVLTAIGLVRGEHAAASVPRGEAGAIPTVPA